MGIFYSNSKTIPSSMRTAILTPGGNVVGASIEGLGGTGFPAFDKILLCKIVDKDKP